MKIQSIFFFIVLLVDCCLCTNQMNLLDYFTNAIPISKHNSQSETSIHHGLHSSKVSHQHSSTASTSMSKSDAVLQHNSTISPSMSKSDAVRQHNSTSTTHISKFDADYQHISTMSTNISTPDADHKHNSTLSTNTSKSDANQHQHSSSSLANISQSDIARHHNLSQSTEIYIDDRIIKLILFSVLTFFAFILCLILILCFIDIFIYMIGDKSDEQQQQQHSETAVQSQPAEMVYISCQIDLYPIMEKNDYYIMDQVNWNHRDLIKRNKDGNLFYRLDPDKALIRLETEQLYHPSSGIIFVPRGPFYWDHKSKRLVHINDYSIKLQPRSNDVYDIATNRVYERCFALAFMKNGNGQYNCHLPRSPAVSPTSAMIDPVRRVQPEELPSIMVKHYKKLLDQWLLLHSQVALPPKTLQFSARKVQPKTPMKDDDDFSEYMDALSQSWFV